MIKLYELNLHKMTTPQEKAQFVSWFIKTKSDVQTQRNYRSKYGRDPPSHPSIRLWHKKFMETGTVFDTRRSGRPRTSEENIERVRQAFHSPGLLSLGFRKGYCDRTKVRNMTDLKQRISNAIATIDEAMLQRTRQEIEYHLDVLCEINGAHIEVYQIE